MFPVLHCQPGEKRKIQLRLIGKREKSPINLIFPVRIGSKLAILNVRSVEAVVGEERCHVFLSVDPHKITPSKRLAIAEHTQLEVRDFFCAASRGAMMSRSLPSHIKVPILRSKTS